MINTFIHSLTRCNIINRRMRLKNAVTLMKLRKLSSNEGKKERRHALLIRKIKRVLVITKGAKMKTTLFASNIFLNIVANTKIEDALSTSHSC